ncbi:MAG: hypothetical protein OXD46_08140 [Chloroflexi bacterium]|nr:hypothetical protein [Chloroflexota bacterium]
MDRDDFAVDLEELFNDIDNAEVVSISFPTFDKSAVFDMRSSESDGPMLRLMPMVSSPRERIRSVRRLRPGFPRPTGLTVIPWHGYVDTLVQNGIWDKLVERFSQSGPNPREALDTCGSALKELRHSEKTEMTAAILGDNYHTIWTSRN